MAKRKNRVKSKNGCVLRLLILVGIIIIIGIVAFTFYLNQGSKPVSEGNTELISVTIPQGTGTAGIANILKENNLIDSVQVFKLKSKTEGLDGKYKAGAYALSQGMSMDEMMQIIISGNSATTRFTIPEGYDIKRTSEKLASENLIDPDLFAKQVESGVFNYNFLVDAPAGPGRLEGYLFPETYDIFTTANEYDIINRMLSQFDKVFIEDYYSRAKELGLSINEVVTIASLIERETRVDAERGLVSSVIHNRLAIKMPLQIDATVQYALGEQKSRLTYKDLEVDSPYNTYKINGLPPGPICSPGAESIHAALYPEETEYYYYVLKPDLKGAHNFAKTYQEFLKYKDQYIKAL